MNKRFAALLTACLMTGGQAHAQTVPQHLKSIPLSIGIYNISAELAQTDQQREIGLMLRTKLAPAEGMLFAFEQAGQQCFWMKNTLIPLDVAFVADDGSIVNIDHMLPQTLDSHCSEKPVRFVLEMGDGWFEKRGIKASAKLRGAPFTK